MHDCLNIDWIDVDGSLLSEDDFLTLNVSGMRYETLKKTLQRFPATLLGDEKRRKAFFLESKNAYFFNRCRLSFDAILYYYQSGGILVRPPSVPMNVFRKEVTFFNLGDDVLANLNEEEGIKTAVKKEDTDEIGPFQRKLWELFEYPDSSIAARIVSAFSMLVIGVSITVFCLETLPVFKEEAHRRHMESKIPNYRPNHTSKGHFVRLQDHGDFQRSDVQPWFSLELICVAWFGIEYIIRFLSSPSKRTFLLSFLNTVDLLAIVPYFFILWMNSGGKTTRLPVLRIARLVRVFRVLKLSRHSMSLQVLGNTLRASLRELGMMIFFLLLGVIVFSSALYYAEKSVETFESIPNAFWYSLVTMTTVGYGDLVPVTRIGKMIGGCCVVTGVLTLALPVPVIVSNFEFFYKRDQMVTAQRKLTEERETEQ